MDGGRTGLSLQCASPGLPLCLAVTLSHLGLGLGIWPWRPRTFRSFDLEASAPRNTHKPDRPGLKLMSPRNLCFLHSHMGGGRPPVYCWPRRGSGVTWGRVWLLARGAGTASHAPNIHPHLTGFVCLCGWNPPPRQIRADFSNWF